MYHGNPQSTGRSRYFGPAGGFIDWEFDSVYSETGIAIGADSTIYFGTTGVPLIPCALYALRPDGSFKWRFAPPGGGAGVIQTTPLVRADGVIYVAGWGPRLVFAVKPDGTQLWEFTADDWVAHKGMNIGLDGTLYFLDLRRTLYALRPDGTLKWRLSDSRFFGSAHSVLVFSPDGKTLYVQGSGVSILAVDIQSQSVIWTFGNIGLQELAPLVDAQGHVYVSTVSTDHNAGNPALFSLNPDGSVRWLYAHNNSFRQIIAGESTIDLNGNIYFVFDTLYSVDYSGNLRWKMGLNGYADSPLVCDLGGTVYLTVNNSLMPNEMMAVNSDGSVMWRIAFDRFYNNDNSPALTVDGRLVFPTWRSTKVLNIR
jgi:outer membrane protein assembly factor BamB